MGKHRTRLKILANVLSVVSADNGAKKTQIMYHAYLSYKLLVQYLNDVIEAELVTCENQTNFKLTQKGEIFLAKFDEYVTYCADVDEYLNQIEDQRLMLNEMCPNNGCPNTASKLSKKM